MEIVILVLLVINLLVLGVFFFVQLSKGNKDVEMIERLGGIVAGCAFLIELDDLKGREAIGNYDYKVLMHY